MGLGLGAPGDPDVEFEVEEAPSAPRDWWVVIPTDSDAYIVQAITKNRAHGQHRRTEQWETTDVLGPFHKNGAEHVLETYRMYI